MIRNFALTALVFLAACSVSEDQEVALGRQDAEEVNSQLPIVTDPAISDYIQSLGECIAKTTSRSDLDWHFYVVNTKQVNAFALPGGFVYVNRGPIESTDRLDELQADSEGVVNVTRAGYDPQGIPDLFQVLLKEREYQPTVVEGWFVSHPLEEARIQRAKTLIAQLPLDRSQKLIVDTPEFQAFKARVSQLPLPLLPRDLPSQQQ